MMVEVTTRPPRFDAAFREKFAELLRWRRDVRRFRADPVDARLLDRLLALPSLAPSVGLSQPWRFVLVETPARREAIAERAVIPRAVNRPGSSCCSPHSFGRSQPHRCRPRVRRLLFITGQFGTANK